MLKQEKPSEKNGREREKDVCVRMRRIQELVSTEKGNILKCAARPKTWNDNMFILFMLKQNCGFFLYIHLYNTVWCVLSISPLNIENIFQSLRLKPYTYFIIIEYQGCQTEHFNKYFKRRYTFCEENCI